MGSRQPECSVLALSNILSSVSVIAFGLRPPKVKGHFTPFSFILQVVRINTHLSWINLGKYNILIKLNASRN